MCFNNPMKNEDPAGCATSIKTAFYHLYSIIKTLRSPNGCPWDKEQTPESLIGSLIEETFECIEAIDEKDTAHIREELGDIILILLMISSIFEEQGGFTIKEVLEDVSKKIIRRHPHVFSDIKLNNSEEVIAHWEFIKHNIEKTPSRTSSILSSVPKNIPPFQRAFLLQKKAQKHGFDWTEPKEIIGKIEEEISEYKDASDYNNRINEMGDLLFSVINLSRLSGIDPSHALHRTNEKFINRFSFMENKMRDNNIPLNKKNIDTMEQYWQEAKKTIKDN